MAKFKFSEFLKRIELEVDRKQALDKNLCRIGDVLDFEKNNEIIVYIGMSAITTVEPREKNLVVRDYSCSGDNFYLDRIIKTETIPQTHSRSSGFMSELLWRKREEYPNLKMTITRNNLGVS